MVATLAEDLVNYNQLRPWKGPIDDAESDNDTASDSGSIDGGHHIHPYMGKVLCHKYHVAAILWALNDHYARRADKKRQLTEVVDFFPEEKVHDQKYDYVVMLNSNAVKPPCVTYIQFFGFQFNLF